MEFSCEIISYFIEIFNKTSRILLKNEMNIKIIIDWNDKFLFSVFKLINKVRLFLFIFPNI